MVKENGIQKIVSVAIIVMMTLSTLAISTGITDARLPENISSAIDGGGKPILQVTELRATTSVVYLDQENRLVLSIANQGNATALKVTANITDIVPKVSEEPITTLNFGTLKPGVEKTRFIDWMPTLRGIHYIKVEMRCEYLTHNSPAEMVESDPTILSAGFPVTPQADTYLSWGPGGWPIYNDNNTVNLTNDPSGIREVSGSLDNQIEIEVNGGLSIENTGTLILNEYVTLVMVNPNEAGEFGIEIQSGGQFIVNSPTTPTTITTSSLYRTNTYPFFNNGTVNFKGAEVWYTHGPSDLSLVGGIQNLDGSVCIIDDCNLLEADTHSLYIGAGADVQVRGTGTVIGSSVSDSVQARGHGIFVNGATPVIEDVTVQYQKQDGIRVENAVGTGPITADTLHMFSSAEYDYRVTETQEDMTPMTPMVANGDIAHMIWVEEEFEGPETVQHLRYTRSVHLGAAWELPRTFASVNTFFGTPIAPSIASDGSYVGIVYIQSDGPTRTINLIYSNDNGITWSEPANLSPVGEWAAGDPCIDWQGETAYIVYKTGPLNLSGVWVFKGIAFRTFSDGTPGRIEELFEIGHDVIAIPKIAVDGNDIHVVLCAPTTSNDMTYIHGSLSPRGWDEPIILTGYNVDGIMFDQHAFDIKAQNGAAYFVWQNYNTENYNIHYMKGTSPFGETNWSAPVPLTTDPGNSLYPSCTIDPDGNLLVVWQDDRDGVFAIRYSALDSNGNVTADDVCLTTDSPEALAPSISVDGSGQVYLAWADARGGDLEIYTKQAKRLVINSNTISSTYIGIDLISSHNNIITNNIILNNGCGISLETSDYNYIRNNNASNNVEGFFFYYSYANILYNNCAFSNEWHGIWLWASSGYIIADNSFTLNERSGIYLDNSSNDNTIVNNDACSNSWDGIWICNSDGNSIANNDITLNRYYGIFIDHSDDNTIFDNTILSNIIDGVDLWGACDNIIANNNISNNRHGIYLNEVSDYNKIIDNNVSSNNYNGIYLWESNINTISNNIFVDNEGDGIFLLDSCINNFTNNTMARGGIYIEGDLLEHWNTHTIDTSNTVNAMPVHYWKNQTGGIIPADAGQVILANCTNVVVENQNISDGSVGISLGFSNNNNIANNNVSSNKHFGFHLYHSISNNITNNIAYSNLINGINLDYCYDNTIIKNTATSNANIGIYLLESGINHIDNNNVSSNKNFGIYLHRSSSNNITNNTAITNNKNGIHIDYSNNNFIINNTASSNNNIGIYISESNINHIANNAVNSNLVYGIQLIVNSENNNIVNNRASNNEEGGICLASSSNNTLINNNASSNLNYFGIGIFYSNNNTLTNNTASNNGGDGINLVSSNGNIIHNNNASNCQYGIRFASSNNNTIINSTVSSNYYYGIYFTFSSNNNMINNSISNNGEGIRLESSSDSNIIINNAISMNMNFGFFIWESSNNNQIYHNDIIDNTIQAYDDGTNQWDDGYPSGGNYWSDYTGIDAMSGPDQNITGSDGIGDTPYTFDFAQDHYPLMSPPSFGKISIPILSGWNFISIPLIQGDTSLPNVLSSIDGQWDEVRYYDAKEAINRTYLVGGSDNTLFNIDHTMGFWINITEVGDGYITVEGRIPTVTSIQLYAGWNLVGYPTLCETMTVGDAFWSTTADRVEVFDADSPTLLSEVGPTYLMKPGEGYWVRVVADTLWTVDW